MTTEQNPEPGKNLDEEHRAEWEKIMADLHVIANTPVDMDKVEKLKREINTLPIDLLFKKLM